MLIDDFQDPGQEGREMKKQAQRTAVHASSGLRPVYITRTDFNALLADGSTNSQVLYAVDEAL